MSRENVNNTIDGYDVTALGDSYAYGTYMYKNSRIVRNQIKAINCRIYLHASNPNDKQVIANFKKLYEESKELEKDVEALKEFEEAKIAYSKR